MDHVENKGATGPSNGSPDKNRSTTHRKAAEEAISQYRAGQGSRSAFGSNGGPFSMTSGPANLAATGGARSTFQQNGFGANTTGQVGSNTMGSGQNMFDMGRR